MLPLLCSGGVTPGASAAPAPPHPAVMAEASCRPLAALGPPQLHPFFLLPLPPSEPPPPIPEPHHTMSPCHWAPPATLPDQKTSPDPRLNPSLSAV